MLRVIRREIRKRESILVDEEDLATAFHALFTPEARERIGPVRIRHQRVKQSKEEAVPAAAESPSPAGPEPKQTESPAPSVDRGPRVRSN